MDIILCLYELLFHDKFLSLKCIDCIFKSNCTALEVMNSF